VRLPADLPAEWGRTLLGQFAGSSKLGKAKGDVHNAVGDVKDAHRITKNEQAAHEGKTRNRSTNARYKAGAHELAELVSDDCGRGFRTDSRRVAFRGGSTVHQYYNK
jgi:hypothetical protein